MRRRSAVTLLLLLGSALSSPNIGHAQQSLAPLSPGGQTVTPAFEGWYRNRDGTFSISFGYLNRNTVEIVDVPVGENNFIAPGAANQGQPSHFHPRRHWGVFAVKVPADFGDKQVTWTLRFRGQEYAIKGSLKPDWEIDAIEGEASADDTPPVLRFDFGGDEGQGPLGVTVGPLTATVGKPLSLPLTVKDDGKAEPVARTGAPVDLAWFMHQGPAEVVFSPKSARLTPTGGKSSTTATFSEPGEYLLRVRANDGSIASAGHAQCCWTNAFVRVTVTR